MPQNQVRMKKTLLLSLCIAFSLQLISQNAVVKTFNYESTTRDTVVEFPDRDHNDYERILMHYSMRCKDGLVSTGSQRNLGCGEWDYSCNTYIVDSTRVDSTRASSPDLVFPGYSGSEFSYTNGQTYSYNQYTQYDVRYDNVIFQDIYQFGIPSDSVQSQFGKSGETYKIEYILRQEDLLDAGLDGDDITGISFNYTTGDIVLTNLRVQIAHTTDTEIDPSKSYDWQQVYFFDTQLNMDDNLLRFYEDFKWEGVTNVAVQISYDQANGTDLDVKSTPLDYEAAFVNEDQDNHYLEVGGSGTIYIADGFESIQEEVTVSFWQFGDDRLPVNSTIFEGRDNSNKRQMNVHLPWSNGQVYWDCGNNGGGYDRINKPADPSNFKGQWNHWAFTKNAMTGEMYIYLNGNLWHSGTGKYNSINVSDFVIGGSIVNNNLFNYGGIDEFRIWNKALSPEEIKSRMSQKINADHEDYDRLILYYDFDGPIDSSIDDLSSYGNHGETRGTMASRNWYAASMKGSGALSNFVPDHNLHQGLYFVRDEEVIKRDSVMDLPQRVDYYSVNGSDLVLDSTGFVYPSGSAPVIDEDGEVVDNIDFPEAGVLIPQTLEYFNKNPMAYEIMSFVTPYGIGIDFGLDGHTWTFDVTEFGPILKGNKRIYLSRGGQWQEEMDIQFEFIEGTPDRKVIDIQQVWPVTQTAYGQILDDWRFEPRSFEYDPNVASYVIKSAITGHGQEGEFIPRNHIMKIGDFQETRQVWKECADNPIYPQGGTWVYDRAGWCPGAATDNWYIDATQYFQFLQTPELDYSVQTASGDSRYIVSVQLIQYGPPNKSLDASVVDIVYPTGRIEHDRFNPTCKSPIIVLKNNGEQAMTNATIEYGVVGKSSYTFNWEGDLRFLSEEQIELNYITDLLFAEEGDQFFARVTSVNGGSDDYAANDEYISDMNPINHYTDDIVIEFRTNFWAQETSYVLYDHSGNIIHSRFSGLSANTTYRDTIRNINGCFSLVVTDQDDDGLSWWANNDGNGYVRMKSIDGSFKDIATDFGKFVEYNFSAGVLTDVEDLELDSDVGIFPNPTQDALYFKGMQDWNNQIDVLITDQLGRAVYKDIMTRDELIKGININAYQSGLYMIHLRDGEKYTTLQVVKAE